MKDKDLNKIVDLAYVGGGWLPANDLAKEISELSGRGQVHSFIECTARDLNFHRCYMSLISFIYDYLPERFKKRVKKQAFYQWLKHLQGKYKILYTFADGTTFIEYESIAFGRMSEKRFHEYVREQLPWIYESVLRPLFSEDVCNNIIFTVEEEFKKFMSKL